MTHPTDEELDEMARDLCHTGELSMLYRCEISDAITALRAQLAEVQAERDAVVTVRDMLGNRWATEKDRADRAEAEGHWEDFLKSAVAEAEKAMRKFPQPNYVISKVAEEAGEVVKAAIHCAEARETAENVRNEMRQLIAMLYRLWVEGDQVHGLSPVSTAALRATGEGEE